MSTKHARLSPSSASRWMACPASVPMSEGIPNESSIHAALGTAAHALGEACLVQGKETRGFLGATMEGFEVTEEMADFVQEYVDFVRSLNGTQAYEQKIQIGEITGEKGAKGTADAIVCDGKTLHVCDLKYGLGVQVFAEENPQMMIYGLGALDQYVFLDITEVVLHIIQPRLNHIDSWATTPAHLAKFAEDVAVASELVREAETNLTEDHFGPGKACRWCLAKDRCEAYARFSLSSVMDDFVDITKPITVAERTFDNATLANLMAALPAIEDWCKGIRARVESELLSGESVPGWKLVEGRRGNRSWGDEFAAMEKLERLLGEGAYTRTVITPAKAEKALKKTGGWETVAGLITQSPGKPSVAPVDDKRPTYSGGASIDDFEDLT